MTAHQIDARSIVSQLKTRRRSLGLSQRDVARRLGTSQSAVSELETLSVEPVLSTLLRYAQLLGVRIEARPAAFAAATDVLIDALRRAAERLTSDTYADVDEALAAYHSARLDALTVIGGPYPVPGRRGWVLLPDAEPSRTESKNWRCQARVADPDGVAFRCTEDADCGDQGDGHQWAREDLTP